MNATFETLLAQPFVQNLGWALIHSLWQGVAVALALRGALALVDERRAEARYAAGVVALLLMLAAPAATFVYLNDAGHAGARRADNAAEFVVADDAHETVAPASSSSFAGESARVATGTDSPLSSHAAAPLQRWAETRVTPLVHWLVLAWLAGALLHTLKIFGGWRAAQRLRREGVRPIDSVWETTLARLRRRMKVRAAVRVRESLLVEVPTVVGWMKPLILIPSGALVGLSASQLEALVAHELAHVRRQDYLVNLLQSLAEALLFYHPAARWVSRQVRAEREHACDDAAVAATEGGALLYARALADLEELRRRRDALSPLAVAADGGSLLARVRRLARPHTTSPRSRTAATSLVFAAPVALALTFAALALAQPDRPVDEIRDDSPSVAADDRRAASRRAVAVTFVSLPTFRAGRDSVETLRRTTEKILAGLDARGVKSVGFVGEANIGMYDNRVREARVASLRAWVAAGHELGNQTHSHRSLYATPLEEMRREVLRGEETAGRLMAERGRRLRYFSYPFLNTGPDAATKRAFESFLRERDYTIHPVTIDSTDWLFAQVHQEALRRGDSETAARVASEYVPYMERMMEFYETLSSDVLGREVPQVLMLTTSPVVADRLDELLAMLSARGYRFVTLEEALRDEAYAQPDAYTGERGISWLQRWAITRGGEFRREPELPPYMRQFDAWNSVPSTQTNRTED
ncbi:MAG TPA: M56 family metallopeptidase [Pyrinomonadaceae bacterium]|nr:M56 family metallopeptidase [Pyrinomonadaceae bacterium]